MGAATVLPIRYAGMAWGESNFLVRTRKLFADHGLVAAVMDSPSDRIKMNTIWRMSPEHAEDIPAVFQFLKKDFNMPVRVVGTSMGTFSAPNADIRLGAEIHGLVLTSSITRSRKKWDIYSSQPNAVVDMELSKITIPTLIVAQQTELKEWYKALGFAEVGTKRFGHLPFQVCFMEINLVPDQVWIFPIRGCSQIVASGAVTAGLPCRF